MSKTYQLKVSFTQGQQIATWNFDDRGERPCCHVEEGDRIQFSFDGPGDIGECIALCGQMQDGLASSPFVEGNRIDLKKTSTLTAAPHAGRWGFSIAFTARNADATSSFYFVPDPEVEVKTRPGSGQLA